MNAVKMMLTLALAGSVLASVGRAAADDDHGEKGERARARVSVPELATKGAPAALVLIAGAIAVVVSRRKRGS